MDPVRALSLCIAVAAVATCAGGGDNSSGDPVTAPGAGTPAPSASPSPSPSPATSTSDAVSLSGEMQVWHAMTLTLEGPDADEAGATNPFTDYAFNVTFSQGGADYTVPGYFAACGDAAESSCTDGNVWRAHFTPDQQGEWSYEISFREGADVALDGGGAATTPFDGVTGTFSIVASNKTGDDFRAAANGRLTYQGGHYLQYADGRPFFKVGADSPENTLAYEDFDATPNRGDRRKDWWPHLDDFGVAPNTGDYLWQTNKGQELLGAWSYLANQGVNAVSFLTFSLGGDDENVFPHLLKVDLASYDGLGDAAQWADGVHHDRFDVSKLDQWDRVFSYGDELGLFLHFKTMETENDQLMDGGGFGRERKLYYRELVARFGHHLALNWNLGEEYSLSSATARETLDYLAEIDPYGHLRVLHTFPGEKEQRYAPLTGGQSELTGASVQTGNQNFNEVRSDLLTWISRSRDAGDPWVVALDEPGNAQRGVSVDSSFPDIDLPTTRDQNDNRAAVRGRVLWNALTAGSAGVEYYYGYQTGCGDLQCQDHETRQEKWNDGANTVAFFNTHIGDAALSMAASDSLLTTGSAATASAVAGVYDLPNSTPKTIAIEAEDIGTNPPGDWVFENDKPGFTGTGYYRWDGDDLFNINSAGQGVLTYVLDIPDAEAGDYRYVFRGRRISRTDGRTDLNNDLWVRVIDDATGDQVQPNGQSGQTWWKMFFSGSLTDWVWSSNLDRQDDVKIPATYNLSGGRYRIEISGRSEELHLDRMTLNQGTNRSTSTSLTTTPDGTVASGGGAATVSGPGVQDGDNYLFANLGDIYVVYAANDADAQILDLSGRSGDYSVRWYDPVAGGPLQTGSVATVSGGGFRALGDPPSNPNDDWAILIQRQ